MINIEIKKYGDKYTATCSSLSLDTLSADYSIIGSKWKEETKINKMYSPPIWNTYNKLNDTTSDDYHSLNYSIYTDSWTTGTISYGDYISDEWTAGVLAPQTPLERMREILRTRQTPMIHVPRDSSRQPLRLPNDVREDRARATLRCVLGEIQFRQFLKNGFITVRAKSGLLYQVYPGHGMTAVFDKGKMVDKLCIVLSGNFPPTDSVIMRYLMILNDEQAFRKLAIAHTVTQRKVRTRQFDDRPLPEILAELRAA